MSGVVLPSKLRTFWGQGQNEGMTRHRARAVLLLFLLLNLTACQTWQAVTPTPMSVAQLIEEDQPERVRVLLRGGNELELERPAVDGDELVAPGNFSMPLADVLVLEVQRFRGSASAGTFPRELHPSKVKNRVKRCPRGDSSE